MALFPDWNSIESTTRWSEGLFWAGIFTLVVVVVTELAAHVYSNRAAYLISADTGIQREALQKQERAAEQRYSAATAKIREKLDSATAELQKIQPGKARHLLDQQAKALVKSLDRFSGQTINVWSSDSSSDSVTLGREFIAVLKRAGWNVPDEVLTGPIAGGDTEGIHVVFDGNISSPAEIPPGIDALISALERFGFISSETLYVDDAAHGRDNLQKTRGQFFLKIGTAPGMKS